MPSGLVVHIQDRERQRTEVLMQDRIRVGTRAQHELRVALPVSISRSGTLIELARTNGHYTVARFADHPGLTINGQPPVAGDLIEDGDELRFNDGDGTDNDTDSINDGDDSTADVSLQFFTVNNKLPLVARGNVTNIRQAANRALVPRVERETQVQPFIEQAAIESSETTRRDDAKVFLREFTRELVREISPVTKLIAFALTVSLVGGLLYFGFAAYREIRNTRRENEELTAKLAGLEKQLDTTGTQIRESGNSYKQLLDSMSLAPTLVASYSDGVCLIGGTYDFVDPATNKPLRYNEGLVSEDGATEEAATQGGESTPSGASQGLTTEGAGAIAEFDFIGTGFHVGDGFILTNRHVVQPWESDERAQFLSGNVAGRPRLKRLYAFFPNQKQQFALRIRRLSSDANVDLAACAIDLKQATGTIPVLPLDNGTDAVGRGKEVVMMGYPTGEDLILARSPEAATGIGQRAGASMEVRLRYLAEQNRIKPSVPRGHITDLEAFRIVHNASNAAGGSGAPLFGQSGRVIGINFGIFAEINNASFAIPIRYGISLLQRAGWKDANDSPTADNTNSNTSNTNNSNAPKTTTNERR